MAFRMRIDDVQPVVHADGHYVVTFTEWMWSSKEGRDVERGVAFDVRVAPTAYGVDIEPWGSPKDGYYEAVNVDANPEARIMLPGLTVERVLRLARPDLEAAWGNEEGRHDFGVEEVSP